MITIKILQNTDSSDVVDHSYIDYYTTMTLDIIQILKHVKKCLTF